MRCAESASSNHYEAMNMKKSIVLIATALTFASGAHAQEAPPECGDSQVKNLVVNTINRNIRENPLIAARAGGVRAISVDSVTDLYSDPAIRACQADLRRSDGVVENGYTVEWIDRASGEFAIQLVGVDTLRARYAAKSKAAPVQAAPAGYEACIDAAASTPDMIDCANAEAQQQDARLNTAYKAAMAAGGDKSALRTAQRQWIKDRDSKCAPDSEGGQNAMLEAADCVATLTASRAGELEAMR